MKASELKVGNYVLLYGSQATIIPNDFQKWFQNEPEWEQKAFKGIPLTEEWLLKFGFKQTDEGAGFVALHFWINLIGEDRLYLRHYIMGGFIWGFNHFEELGQPIDIEYVHQLQNLYFALTGNELTIQ